MINDLEHKIIARNKLPYFGEYLQNAYMIYPLILEDISEKGYASTKELNIIKEINERTNNYRMEFNITYNIELSRSKINPLKIEQQAWQLLSPLIQNYLDMCESYIKNNSSKTEKNKDRSDRITEIIKTGHDLIKKWDIISKSYKSKYLRNSNEEIIKTENNLKELITTLNSKQI